MQPITWTQEEFKANVAKKLAALKAVREAQGSAMHGTSFDERQALVKA